MVRAFDTVDCGLEINDDKVNIRVRNDDMFTMLKDHRRFNQMCNRSKWR